MIYLFVFLLPVDIGNKETDVLLMLYEFEARVKLKDPAVESVLEKALTMTGTDPKIFETLAGKYYYIHVYI